MSKDDIEKILNWLEGISLSEWKRLKECIDREFNAQVNNSKFTKRESFKKDLEIEFIQ